VVLARFHRLFVGPRERRHQRRRLFQRRFDDRILSIRSQCLGNPLLLLGCETPELFQLLGRGLLRDHDRRRAETQQYTAQLS
jgi:hypothetical protein